MAESMKKKLEAWLRKERGKSGFRSQPKGPRWKPKPKRATGAKSLTEPTYHIEPKIVKKGKKTYKPVTYPTAKEILKQGK
jgi:hypothetical protein